jgi:hypothetical protein
MAIPVEAIGHSDIVASYPAQDIEEARKHRDRLKAEGRYAFLTRSTSHLRYGDRIIVWARSSKTA